MSDQRIKFETAKLAKEKGFNITQRYGMIASLYDKDGNHTYYANYGLMSSGLNDGYISAPTQAALQKWLREVHNINVWVEHGVKNTRGITHDVVISGRGCLRGGFKEYEDAMEFGLVEGLNLINIDNDVVG